MTQITRALIRITTDRGQLDLESNDCVHVGLGLVAAGPQQHCDVCQDLLVGPHDGVVYPLVVILRAGQDKVRLVELHDVLVRILPVRPDPQRHQDVVVVQSQPAHHVHPVKGSLTQHSLFVKCMD